MLVTISGTPYFSAHTWGEVYTPPGTLYNSTWGEEFFFKWQDLVSAYNNLVMMDGPSVQDIVESRSTADFTILDMNHAFAFEKGEYVSIQDFEYQVMFSGFIEESTQIRISPDGVIAHKITCSDNHYLADKRIIAKAFVATSTPTVADCVLWILNNILDAEDVTVGSVVSATAIESISFDYVKCSDALDTLAQYGNCTWYIDYAKRLYFVERTSYPAAWNITEVSGVMADVLADSFQVTSSNPEYRNQQYIRGGYAETALQTETTHGDGEKTSYPVGYKISREPVITVYRSPTFTPEPQDVGIKGVETGKDFYWSANDQIILQDSSVPANILTSNDYVTIEYYGIYQIVTSSANFAQIIDRQTKEGGGSGIVDAIQDDSLVTTQDAGLDEANALLDHYADIGTKIEYTTLRKDLEVGTLQHITSTIHNINDDFLITQVDKIPQFHDDTGAMGDLVKYQITAISGPVEDYWTKFFLKLKGVTSTGSLANSTSVVLVLRSFTHAWAAIDTPNIWTASKADSTADCDTSNVPGFENGSKIKYISLWKNLGGTDTELYRKYYTAQTETTNVRIITTFILASGEANFAWDTIHIFGGDTATDAFGSGIDLYQISDSYNKNNLEALQMVFTDTHW